jgi:hypothetical protein
MVVYDRHCGERFTSETNVELMVTRRLFIRNNFVCFKINGKIDRLKITYLP